MAFVPIAPTTVVPVPKEEAANPVAALAVTVANQLYTALQTRTITDVQLLARAMELVEAVPGLPGAQKKAVLLAALDAVSERAAGDTSLSATVRAVAATCDALVDVVAAVAKQKPEIQGAGTGAMSSMLAAITQIEALVASARAGAALTVATVAALLPGIVRALTAMTLFATASVEDQVQLATQLLESCRLRAGADEQPAWAAAQASIGPVIYALAAARAGTLGVNVVVAAVLANPEVVLNACMTCVTALSAAFRRR